jgi:hypothetical protein
MVKCQSYGIHLCYWSEGLIIVNTMNLLKSFGNKPVFVSANLSIHSALGPIDPSASDKFPPRRKGNQIRSLVLKEGVVLLLHGRIPKRDFQQPLHKTVDLKTEPRKYSWREMV